MDTYTEFVRNNKTIPDPVFEQQVKDMQTYLQQFVEEGKRLEFRVSTLAVREKELIAIEEKLKEVTVLEEAKRNSLKELTKKVSVAEATLIDTINTIELRKQDLLTFNDLTEQITELKIEKSSLESFINDNHISKHEKDFITNQLDALRQELRNLETKRSEVVKEIIQKEAEVRKLERDLEQPMKILAEAKTLKSVADSTLEAARKIQQGNDAQPGTIGAYVRKLQKKYPHIDFLNID